MSSIASSTNIVITSFFSSSIASTALIAFSNVISNIFDLNTTLFAISFNTICTFAFPYCVIEFVIVYELFCISSANFFSDVSNSIIFV